MKKVSKIGVIILGSVAGVCILGLSTVGLGTIFCEQYHDPEHWPHTVFQSTMYGLDRKFNFGWCA